MDPEIRTQTQELNQRTESLWQYLAVETKQEKIKSLEVQMTATTFWDNREKAQEILAQIKQLKRTTTAMEGFKQKVEDLNVLVELVEAEEESKYEEEVKRDLVSLFLQLETLEVESFLNGPHDSCNAIITIHAGAGGTESCDWAEMLFRQYTRWAERRGFKVEIQDIQVGEEAGFSRATIRLIGTNVYGYAKAERGVHRLVRISPFDSNKRRHTSFCAVDVIPEIEEDLDLEIKEEELRIDTYRSSGKGGQHVNTTDSAVRITHVPTGLVACCQNGRSQHKNKETAMKMLKCRLYAKLQDDKRSEQEKFYGEKGEIGWGNQIRSYVFQPYQMVKDLRTGVETSDVKGVMDGNLDPFVTGWLRAGSPRDRCKH